tara:strand:+ start:927 stop:2360 length:1434 start_codon:yes stop_codon:yes gene_type:complete
MNNKIIPLILCGGDGKRLWPLSRKSYPKQFLKLKKNSKTSLLQATHKRISNIENLDAPILVCNEEHRFLVAEQMREIGIKPKAIILEPIGKNTAPAITLGALKALEDEADDSVLLVLSADHVIENSEQFRKVINLGYNYAKKERLVTFGIVPKYPETGYGYIESYKSLENNKLEGANINKFIEKPDFKLASEIYKDKKYTWNSGIFMFTIKKFLQELELHAPSILSYCKNSFDQKSLDLDFIRINNAEFQKSPEVSIDVAIMEKTSSGTVLPLEANWSDIGSWKSVWESEEKDSNNNVLLGNIIEKESNNCYLRSDNRILVALGLKDLIVVETSDAVLVSKKDSSKELKSVVEDICKKGLKEGTNHRKTFRPWGNYTLLVSEDRWQVKRIEVNPGSMLSLQMHHHRAEHWTVVTGTANIELDEKKIFLGENQSIFIPLGAKHRLHNPGKIPLVIIEVQTGTYLGEDDIVRFKDEYGR